MLGLMLFPWKSLSLTEVPNLSWLPVPGPVPCSLVLLLIWFNIWQFIQHHGELRYSEWSVPWVSSLTPTVLCILSLYNSTQHNVFSFSEVLKTVIKSSIPCNRGSSIHLDTTSWNLSFQEDKYTFQSRTGLRWQHLSPNLLRRSFSEVLEYLKVFVEEYLHVFAEEYLKGRLDNLGDNKGSVQLSCLSQSRNYKISRSAYFIYEFLTFIWKQVLTTEFEIHVFHCLSVFFMLHNHTYSYSCWCFFFFSDPNNFPPPPNISIATGEKGRELTTPMYK